MKGKSKGKGQKEMTKIQNATVTHFSQLFLSSSFFLIFAFCPLPFDFQVVIGVKD